MVLSLPLMREIGDREAIILTQLISYQQYLLTINQIQNSSEGFFYEYKHISNDIGYTPAMIARYIKKLENLGFISVKRKGIPPRNYYTINIQKVNGILKQGDGNGW